MTLITPDFTYDCAPVRIIDGDTIEADLSRDIGFRCRPSWRWRLRIEGIDCPEMRGVNRPLGMAARSFTEQWLAAEPVAAQTLRQDSFGRWLSKVYRVDGSSLADALIEAGHAVRWKQPAQACSAPSL